MLRVQNLSKSYGGRELFENVNLQMNPGERLGLVGRNGYGKSTLFRIILGEEEADDGTVNIPRGYRIGHLAQHLHFTQPTLLEEGCLGLPEGEEAFSYKVERILFGLGFTKEDMDRPPAEFSGGYQIRLNLTKVLVNEPNLLLLDEPTNYLDIVSIRWITEFLREWPNELILISHDREFMDDVTTHTAILHRQQLRKIQGGTEKLYAQILQDEEIHEKTRLNQAKKLKQEQAFIDRFRAQATKASAVQSRIKRLEKMPALEKLAHLDELDFSFRYSSFAAERLMELRGVSFHYEPSLPLIQDLDLKIQPQDRIAVIGKNGKGKSTLLGLMAGELKPAQGEIIVHPEMKLGYFGQTNIQRLHKHLTVEEEIGGVNLSLGKTAVRSICGTMMFTGDQAEKKISVLSGGERSRVLLGKILAQPSNLLFLDEPTNHLDMESIEALIESIQEFPGAVVIVTHSEMILKDIATKLVVFHRGGVEVFAGNYGEFLEKIGWEEEGEVPSSSRRPAAGDSGLNKKAARKRRSKLLGERSKILGPLKKEIEASEQDITRWEAEVRTLEQDLLRASHENDADAMTKANRRLKELRAKIDGAFDRLSEAQVKYEAQERQFAALLQEIG